MINISLGGFEINSKKTKPFGSWSSPLKAEDVASATIGLEDVRKKGNRIYWVEMRPEEKAFTFWWRGQRAGRIEILRTRSSTLELVFMSMAVELF